MKNSVYSQHFIKTNKYIMHKCLQTDTDAQPYLLVFMMKSSIYELKGKYVQSFFE